MEKYGCYIMSAFVGTVLIDFAVASDLMDCQQYAEIGVEVDIFCKITPSINYVDLYRVCPIIDDREDMQINDKGCSVLPCEMIKKIKNRFLQSFLSLASFDLVSLERNADWRFFPQ